MDILMDIIGHNFCQATTNENLGTNPCLLILVVPCCYCCLLQGL